MYTADWNSIKLSAAYTYTWMESAATVGLLPGWVLRLRPRSLGSSTCFKDQNTLNNDNLHQIGGSILHKPSGLGIFGQYTHEEHRRRGMTSLALPMSSTFDELRSQVARGLLRINNPETNTWYVKPFWRKVWGSMNGVGLGSLGATTLFGEYGQYNDQFNAFGGGLCSAFDGSFGTNIDTLLQHVQLSQYQRSRAPVDVFVTGSEVQRWGLGVVQEIDAAAMHVYARWQHQEIDLDLTGINETLIHSDGSTHLQQGARRPGLRQLGSVPGRRHHLLLSQPPGTHIHRKPPPFGAASFCLSAPTNSSSGVRRYPDRSLLPEPRNTLHPSP